MRTMILIFALGIAFSAFAQQDVASRSEELAALKVGLESVMDKGPYKAAEHTKIKAYFAELDSFNQDLNDYPKYLRRFNQYLRNNGVDSFCKSTRLDQKRWNDLIKNCTKNSFFLCTDDVKNYPAMKLALFNLLEDDNKSEMTKSASCK